MMIQTRVSTQEGLGHPKSVVEMGVIWFSGEVKQDSSHYRSADSRGCFS